MLDAQLVREVTDSAELEAYFIQALTWSIGGALLEDGRVKFDTQVKYLASLPPVTEEGKLAGPGQYRALFKIKNTVNCNKFLNV